ncbi:hypothetical protein AB0H86_09195 [Streptomyces sp. NPDC050997]|uniref:hypothetical protein n=1 Tax=Streptomyces sp. NPDC050997 TaxID=3155519 RepID=UPI00343B78ED
MPQHNPHPVPDEPGGLIRSEVRGWQDGYDVGISSPPDVPRTPLVRDPDYARAWTQGAAAGNSDGRTEGWRWAYFEGAVQPVPKEAAGDRYGPQDSGVSEHGDAPAFSFAQSWPCVGESPLLVMLAQFAPGERGGDGLTGRRLARACVDKGVPRLYLPVSLTSSGRPEERNGDPLRDAGYWHGAVSESLDEAAPEAIAQVTVRAPRFAAVVRYAPTAEHDFFDLLPVGGLLPPERGAS